MIYDVAVIGGGPVGISIVGNLAPRGKSVIVFEKNKLGGVCLNEGCMPTKALLHSANVFETVSTARKAGVKTIGNAEFDYKEISQRKNQIVQALNMGVDHKLAAAGVKIVNSFAHIDGENADGTIRIKADGEIFTAKKLIIGAGSENLVPPIAGIENADYISSREVLNLEEAPKSLTVIGGGVLGLEFAALFSTLGTQVDLIERASEILPSMDSELASILRKEYEKKGIVFHLNATAESIDGKTVTISVAGKQSKIVNDSLLLAMGRKAASEKLNLEALNIKTEKSAIVVNNKMQSSHPNVYACGDIIGGSMLAHTAMHEGRVAANTILGIEDELNYNAIPAVVYTNPEMAAVGATEEVLKMKGVNYRVIKAPLAQSGRYILDNDFETPGFIKMLVDEVDQTILGVHILGNPASEIISIASMAIAEGYTVDKLRRIVFPHPTVAGIFQHMV